LTLCFPAYSDSEEQQFGIVGILHSIGSDTLDDVITQWASAFQKRYPHIRIQIQTSGSSAAPIAIIGGTASIGPMSRPLRDSERQSFVKKYHYEPTMLTVGIDAIGVFVHPANPVQQISQYDLDAAFSVTRFCGARNNINRWWGLIKSNDLTEFAQSEIRLYGRNSASGTYAFFKQTALCAGDYKAEVHQQPSSSAIIRSVANQIDSLGYASIGAISNLVKPLALENQSGEYISLNEQNIQSGAYPLTRNLYLMINKPPEADLSPSLRAFLRFIYSDEGQSIVSQNGYVPVSDVMRRRELAKFAPLKTKQILEVIR
jgi:phosphate transport system substrate-binding protein